VLLVTSSDAPHDIASALEAGADDFIAKPFDPDELSARVRAGQRIIELQAGVAHSRAYLEAVLSHIDSGVLLMDCSGHVVYVNDALVRMLGMPHERALQLTRADFVRLHTERFGDANTLAERLGVGEMLPFDAEIDLEVTTPERRVFRWIAKQVPLPEGPGQLDLLRDVTDEVERERQREKLARIDHLTGLLNRHAADESFAREVARARRTGQPLSIVLSDIDHFKRVNDTFGHGVGDQVLREVSRTLAARCRVTDVAIRWGGEELLVLLPNTPLAGAAVLAEGIRSAVEAIARPDLPRVTVSCGVAQLEREDSRLDNTVERADARLYEAKASGRNAVR
jgi:diguanylate cyclase (GGDEF)-like protein